MAASRNTAVLYFLLVLSYLLSTNTVSESASEQFDSSFDHEIQLLKSKIAFLEKSINVRAHELRNKDDRISQIETVVQEKADSVASLQSEIEYTQQKRSTEGEVHVSDSYVKASELEKQVDKLKKEIEMQNEKKEALEVRANIAERKIQELNKKLQNLDGISNEQKSIIHKAEYALQQEQENLVEAKLFQAASRTYELREDHGGWVPQWLAVHIDYFKSYLDPFWIEHGKPALKMTIQKAMEKKEQFDRTVEPHIEAMKTEWIPSMVEKFDTFMINFEQRLQLLFTRATDFYHVSEDYIIPHVLKIARKFAEPYISDVLMATKPHFISMKVALKPCTKILDRAFEKFTNSWTLYHHQVHETLKHHELSRSLSNVDLNWFAATALLTLPIIVFLQLLVSLLSKRTAKPPRNSQKPHSRVRGKRRHPDR